MKKKNLDLYLSKYDAISTDKLVRIQQYLDSHHYSSKDINKIQKEIERISNIPTYKIKMIFYVIPEATPRPRLNFLHGNFYVSNASDNNNFFKLTVNSVEELRSLLVTTACQLCVNMYFPIPSGMNKVDIILAELGMINPICKPDWDNLGKTYSDMIQKWLLLDDNLVTIGRCDKHWSLKPRVEIELAYQQTHDCIFNKRRVTNSKFYQEAINNLTEGGVG